MKKKKRQVPPPTKHAQLAHDKLKTTIQYNRDVNGRDTDIDE